MKISPATLTILKNFVGLNVHFQVKPGSILRTISSAVIASAQVEELFPQEFAVGNLSKFLSAISLFENPDLEFYDNYVKIAEKGNYVRYVYDEPSLLSLPPDKNVKMPPVDVTFDISESDLALIMKATSSLQSPQLVIAGEDGTIYVKATDTKNSSVTDFSMAVGVTDKEFKTAFNAANFRFLLREYHVSLVIGKIAEFKSDNLTYWIVSQIG